MVSGSKIVVSLVETHYSIQINSRDVEDYLYYREKNLSENVTLSPFYSCEYADNDSTECESKSKKLTSEILDSALWHLAITAESSDEKFLLQIILNDERLDLSSSKYSSIERLVNDLSCGIQTFRTQGLLVLFQHPRYLKMLNALFPNISFEEIWEKANKVKSEIPFPSLESFKSESSFWKIPFQKLDSLNEIKVVN